ncbi:MAG TPA: hypothetical protein VKF82_06645 [Candidatus Eremiobacteraceae bacterium]|nr:hypothetical protein [Candidatus Eremiobacteraceae bacterium]
MKLQIVAVSNSINDALDAIDSLSPSGVLEPASAEALKLLYVWGWNDGFASIRRADESLVFGMRTQTVKRALHELSSRGFIQLRDAGDSYAVEITSLAMGGVAPGFAVSWWRYYEIQIDVGGDEADR